MNESGYSTFTRCNSRGPSRKGRQAGSNYTHTHTRTLIARSSEASSICDSSKSLADIDLVPRLAAHSGRSGAFQEQLEGAETTAGDGG